MLFSVSVDQRCCLPVSLITDSSVMLSEKPFWFSHSDENLRLTKICCQLTDEFGDLSFSLGLLGRSSRSVSGCRLVRCGSGNLVQSNPISRFVAVT